jgi:glycosyltransferase involved in cell wall biosynthesis
VIRLLELRSAWGAGGGPEKTILLSAARHDRRRVRPVVAYLKDPRDAGFETGVRARAREAGTRILEVQDGGRLDPCCVRRLRRLARKADVIHTHDYKTEVYGLLLGRGGGRARLVATAHGWTRDAVKTRLYETIDLLALRFFDRVIAVSEATRRDLIAGGVHEERIVLLRNGIDETVWRPAHEDMRAELGIPREAPVVGTVTRLSPEKGVDLLLEAAVRVPGATFLVLGEGTERAKLLDRARALGVAERVRFLGHVSDVRRALATFDVFVLPSRVENAPNALLEAMACEKACVAFDVGGMRETLGDTGVLVEAADTAGLAERIASLIARPDARRAFGARARARIEREFSFSRRLSRIEALYEEVCDEQRPSWTAPSTPAFPPLRRGRERAA